MSKIVLFNIDVDCKFYVWYKDGIAYQNLQFARVRVKSIKMYKSCNNLDQSADNAFAIYYFYPHFLV